jgi:hypothetical protein
MLTVRIPAQYQLFIKRQNLESKLRRESNQPTYQTGVVQAEEHYNALASRQFSPSEIVASDARYLGMVKRLDYLSSLAFDTPITQTAIDAAKSIVAEVLEHILRNYPIASPAIFATRNSRISLEWQPRNAEENVIGSILLTVDGEKADFQLETFDGSNVEVLLSEEEADLSTTRTFLAKLTDAIRVRREAVDR